MKNSIVLVVFFILIQSCTVSKKGSNSIHESNPIIYLMPYKVEELIKTELSKSIEDVYFELWSEDSTYSILAIHIDKRVYNPWIQQTNRKLYINGKFYPLLFDFDRVFAITENSADFLKKLSTEEYPMLSHKLSVNEASFYVKFKKKSNEIIESGYDGLKRKG